MIRLLFYISIFCAGAYATTQYDLSPLVEFIDRSLQLAIVYVDKITTLLNS